MDDLPMPVNLARRCALVLFLALSLGVGCGLIAAPAFDPLAWLPQGGWARGSLPFLLHGLLAWGSTVLVRRQLSARVDASWSAPAARWALNLGVVAALAWWAASAWSSSVPDARALLWLELLPVWLAASGVLRDPLAERRRLPADVGSGETTQHFRHDTRLMNQIDVGSGGHMTVLGASQQRMARREHDVVAVAEKA
jgi:hypothetical protein